MRVGGGGISARASAGGATVPPTDGSGNGALCDSWGGGGIAPGSPEGGAPESSAGSTAPDVAYWLSPKRPAGPPAARATTPRIADPDIGGGGVAPGGYCGAGPAAWPLAS